MLVSGITALIGLPFAYTSGRFVRIHRYLGVASGLLSIGFGLFLFVRRLVLGPESDGLFTLFAILFVFIGFLILAVGLVGEYVGRIYLEVRGRPPYVVRAIYLPEEERPCARS